MKKTISITQKFIIFVSIFSILAAADLWFYISGAKELEKYASVSNILSSIKSDVVSLEYALDIFVVARDFEKGYGTEGVKDNAAVIDRGIGQLEKLPLAAIFGGNVALSGEYHAFVNDWKSLKEKIGGVTKAISREEAMLIHNDIDLKTFLIKERLERFDKFTYDEKIKAVSDINDRIIYAFIFSAAIILIIAYLFYNRTLKPIKTLIATAAPSPSGGGDEITALSNMLNSMADAVNMAHNTLEKDILDRTRELEARTKEFAALNRVAGLASRTISQEEIADVVLDELIQATKADAGWVYLTELNDGGSALKLRLNVHRGVSHIFIREAKEVKPEELKFHDKEHMVMDVSALDSRLRVILQDMGFKQLCILPIIYTNSLIGVICLAGKGADCFSGSGADSCAFAESMANEMAIAIEHARLFQREFKSKQFMERIIHQSPVSIAVFDKNGACIMLNTVCKKLFGMANDDQIIGKWNLFKDNELEEKGYAHTINRIFDGESVDMEVEYDISNVRHIQAKAGLKRLKIKAFPIADNDGSISNIAVMHEDVTKEYELKNRMFQSEKLSAVSRLASGITHELNNPLTGIAGYAQLLKSNKEGDPLLQDTIAKIAREAERANIIVKNLLMFTREYKPQKSYVNINAILSSALERKMHDLKGNNIEAVREFTDSIPWTMADASQLQQVFLNILDNAMDAIKDGGKNGKITVKTKHCKPGGDVYCSTCRQWGTDGVLVEFTDNGSGISEENQKRLFEPFFTTKPNGTGLGLSVSYGIIKGHGGAIYARSAAGSGATFTVEIPVIKKETIAKQDER